MVTQLFGLIGGQLNVKEKRVEFTFQNADGRKQDFAASFGVASQITAALAKMVSTLRAELDRSGPGTAVLTAAEPVAQTHIQKDRWSDAVLIQLTDPRGVPYAFQVTTQVGLQIAEQLKIESSKPT